MESNHHSARRRGYSAVSSPDAQRPLVEEKGDRPDSNRYREDHDLGCCRYTTATMKLSNGDDRARTGALSPDKRVLYPSELRPRVACNATSS